MIFFLLPLIQEGLFLVTSETSIVFSSKSDVLHPLWCQKDPNFTKCNLKIKKCDFLKVKNRIHIQRRCPANAVNY